MMARRMAAKESNRILRDLWEEGGLFEGLVMVSSLKLKAEGLKEKILL
jgi:hypothetical protein